MAVLVTLATTLSIAPAARGSVPEVVAIGDSYMAGVGAGDYTVTDDCRRSAASYAADAARRTASALVDESCPGARIPQVLAQAGKVPATADTVLVQVGGNDAGFSAIAFACLLPFGANCLDQIAQSRASLPAIGEGLREIGAVVRTRSPGAQVVFAGYPRLLASPGACASTPLGSLLDAAEVRAINALQTQLDLTIKAAARASGATYVDWPRAADRHSLCSSDPWFVTLEPREDALHPTAKAYAAMGRSIAPLLRR